MATSPTPSTSSQALLEFGPDSGGRVKDFSITKPIVIGNVATPFGKKRESDGHTHSWTIYVKPYLNEDYSAFIKKVQFKLHDSYEDPKRVITEPPFEVSETGWGEFDVPIKIFFVDPNEKPVTVHHALKLFQSTDGTESQALQFTAKKKSVTAESYDEIVFIEPTQYMKTLLENLTPLTMGVYKHETDFETKIQESNAKITDARSLVRAEIEVLKMKLRISRQTYEAYKQKLEDAQNSKQPTSEKSKKKSSPKTLAKELSSMKLNSNSN